VKRIFRGSKIFIQTRPSFADTHTAVDLKTDSTPGMIVRSTKPNIDESIAVKHPHAQNSGEDFQLELN
jgi:hypothetical protein